MFQKKLLFSVFGSFSCGVLVGGALLQQDMFKSRPVFAASTNLPALPSPTQQPVVSAEAEKLGGLRLRDIMKHGYPSLDNIRVFDDYVLSYDRRTRVAHWVFEHLTYPHLKPAPDTDRGKCEFREDMTIHPYFRSTNRDYKGSGYDRGHMAAAANHRSSQHNMNQTFFLSNMSPQVGSGFNRDKWNELEKEVRNMTKKYDNIWVCTGPLFLPKREADNKLYVKYEVIGPNNVAVPTHFFKVILCEKSGDYSLFSYVLPNAQCDNAIPLNSYMVPIDSIERAAGFLLFDRIPKQKFKQINGK